MTKVRMFVVSMILLLSVLLVACGEVTQVTQAKPHITGNIEDFKQFYGTPVSITMQVKGFDTGYMFKDDGKSIIVFVKDNMVVAIVMDVGDGITDDNLLVYMPIDNITKKPFINSNGETCYSYTPSNDVGTVGEIRLLRADDSVSLLYSAYPSK